MKHKVSYLDPQGEQQWILGGRLESTMQNIADYMVDSFPRKLKKDEYRFALQTFIIYNRRIKTISTTKQLYHPLESPLGTPEQTYYDLLSNHYDLFRLCQFKLPEWNSFEETLAQGPSSILLFHPALGPLYSVIAQKIRRGKMAPGSELQLEIAEADIEDLDLTGSLLIESACPLGIIQTNSIHEYGNECRCSLKKLTICNQGIDRTLEQDYWIKDLKRVECVKIILHEGAEFHAEGILLEGSHTFEVPAHHRLVLLPRSNGGWKEELIPIDQPTWSWHYSFDNQNRIHLTKTIRSNN